MRAQAVAELCLRRMFGDVLGPVLAPGRGAVFDEPEWGAGQGPSGMALRQMAYGMALVGCVCVAGPALAQMKYFQIARLLNFKTECQMSSFEDRSPPTGPGRFVVKCDNVTFYPDGLELECPDREDEWTCRILTDPRRFQGLEILRQK